VFQRAIGLQESSFFYRVDDRIVDYVHNVSPGLVFGNDTVQQRLRAHAQDLNSDEGVLFFEALCNRLAVVDIEWTIKDDCAFSFSPFDHAARSTDGLREGRRDESQCDCETSKTAQAATQLHFPSERRRY